MLKKLAVAVAKATLALCVVVVFVIGVRIVEWLIESAVGNIFLWDILAIVICFCWLVYFFYKPQKGGNHADREG